MNILSARLSFLAIFIVLTLPTSTLAEEGNTTQCEMSPSEKPDSPWDYRTRKDRLELVESRHFTRQVELLIRGESTINLAADIAYTLRMFPNHHRALASLVRYADTKKTNSFVGMKYSVDCYLQRAVNFKEDDPQTRIIYASHLIKNRRLDKARAQLEYLEQYNEKNSTLNYNIGLIFFFFFFLKKSLQYAHQAYSEGFPLPGLKNKLVKIGKWIEPQPNKPIDPENSSDTPSIPSVDESR